MFVLAGTGSVSLPNPQIGDTWAMNLNLTKNQTVDGTLLVYKGDRVTYFNYKFSFTGFKLAVRDALITFLTANAGKQITITASQSQVNCSTGVRSASADLILTGYITTSSPVITTLRDNCSYAVDLDFMQTAGDTITPYVDEVRNDPN